MAFAISLHLLAAVVWIGGMFFAYMCLRPSAAAILEPPARLRLWSATFARFFPWVWIAIIILPASGYWIVFKVMNGLGSAGLHIQLMNALGIAMILLYLYVYFLPYRQLKEAIITEQWPQGAQALAQIRRIVGTNLVLGLIVTVIASAGRYIQYSF